MEWTKEKTIQFIEFYRAYSLLWDSTHEYYKNKVKRHGALLEIAAKFDIEKAEVERKIKNLQSHFLREYKRIRESKKSGSGADEIISSKWFAYNSLLFLASRNKHCETLDSQITDSTVDESSESSGIGYNEKNVRKRIRNTTDMNETVLNPYEIMKEVYSKPCEKDEYSLFGEQVAIKLRKISSPYSRVTAQNKINIILMKAELGFYDCHGHDQIETEERNSTQASLNSTTTYISIPIKTATDSD